MLQFCWWDIVESCKDLLEAGMMVAGAAGVGLVVLHQ